MMIKLILLCGTKHLLYYVMIKYYNENIKQRYTTITSSRTTLVVDYRHIISTHLTGTGGVVRSVTHSLNEVSYFLIRITIRAGLDFPCT